MGCLSGNTPRPGEKIISVLLALAILAPVFSQSADNIKAAYLASCTISDGTVENLTSHANAKCTVTPAVPIGKRLVIENASAHCLFNGNANTIPPTSRYITLKININGSVNGSPEFPLTDLVNSTGPFGTAMRRTIRAESLARLYTDSAPVFYTSIYDGTVTSTSCTFSVSGFLSPIV